MRKIIIVFAFSFVGFWLTPDQQGQRLFDREQFAGAADRFEDPFREGVAWFRAGEFEKSVRAFSRVNTPEAFYNAGNAWVMLGKYDRAVASYEKALAGRPGWQAAEDNLALAAARGELLRAEGGDMGDQKLGADKIVFDKDKDSGGQDTELAGQQATSAQAVQAIWLRQVQTRPADFLRSKFAYQQAMRDRSGEP